MGITEVVDNKDINETVVKKILIHLRHWALTDLKANT